MTDRMKKDPQAAPPSGSPDRPGAGYVPIDCDLHDHLEVFALHRRPVLIRHRLEGDVVREEEARILDVRAEGEEEFLFLDSGERIRLDRLEEVEGIDFRSSEG